jgi:ribulose-5-phosphate 4-epimerase/fuculose-1-phosphate aldolase
LPESLDDVLYELALANRILANEGILDAFGHVSVRHPGDPSRYLMSRSRGPELVEPADLLEYNLDSEPIVPPTVRLYSERVIHGEIFKSRPEVMAVCHHHSPAVLPFCITGKKLRPIYHLGGVIGDDAPFWDQRDEFGDTNLLVVKPEEGRSLARALGANWVVLMRRHGATVAGTSIRDLVFRTIYSCRNAEYQLQAEALGAISPLNANEARMAGELHHQPGPINRAWEYWVRRVEKKGEAPPRPTRARSGAAGAKKSSARRSRPAARGAGTKKKTARKGTRR